MRRMMLAKKTQKQNKDDIKKTNIKNVKEEIKKITKKKKRKVYFGIEVQDAIVKYNSNPDNFSLRNKIYQKEELTQRSISKDWATR